MFCLEKENEELGSDLNSGEDMDFEDSQEK